MHHGVKGMKWGVRHDPQRSVKGTLHRGLSKVYGVNERYYRKTGNKTLASMNAQAKNAQLKKAAAADKNAGLSTKQKKIIKGVAVGAAITGAGVLGVAALKSGAGKSAISKGARYLRMGKTDAKIMKIGVKDAINSGKSNLKRTVDSKRAEAYVNKIIKNDRKRIKIVQRRSQVANNLARKNNKDLADRTKKYNTYMSTVRTDWRGAYAVPKYRTKGNIKVIGKTY